LYVNKSLRSILPEMKFIIDDHLKKIKLDEAESFKLFDLESFFVSLTLTVFSQTQFKIEPTDKIAVELSKKIGTALLASLNPSNLLRLKMKLNSHALDEARDELLSIVRELTINNEKNILESENLLKKIFELDQKQMQVEETEFDLQALLTPHLLAESTMMLLAGHETTSRLLQFLIVLLSNHPETLNAIYQEIADNRPEDGEWTLEKINDLKYLQSSIKESLRLYPPAGVIARYITRSFALDDIILSKGDIVFIAPMITHRLDSYFPEGDKFIPERWFDAKHPAFKKENRFSYLPFGVADRDCVGRNFAKTEAALFMIEFLEHMKKNNLMFETDATHPIKVKMPGTIKPKKPINMFVQRKDVVCDQSNSESKIAEAKRCNFS